MPIIICVCSHKGGSGKTTCAVNLAACLAVYEFNTLLIDLDPAGFAAFSLDPERSDRQRTIVDASENGRLFTGPIHGTALDRLQFIQADTASDPGADDHAHVPESKFLLRSRIRDIPGDYDFVVLDTPPGSGWTAMNAIREADRVIIPQPLQVYSLRGLENFIADIRRIRAGSNDSVPDDVSVLLIRRETSGNPDDSLLRDLLKPLEPFLLGTRIPWDIRFQDLLYQGSPLLLTDIASAASSAYMELTREVIARSGNGGQPSDRMRSEPAGAGVNGGSSESREKYRRLAVDLAGMIEEINNS